LLLVQNYALVVTGLLNLAIAGAVISKHPRSIVHRAFFLFVFGIALWIEGIALLFLSKNFIFNQFIFYGVAIIFAGLVIFTRVFPNGLPPPRRFYLILLPAVAIAALAPFNIFVSDIIVLSDGTVTPVNASGMPYITAIITVYFFISAFFLVQNFRRARGKSRVQLGYLLTGISVLIASTIFFDAILPALAIYQFNVLGPMASIVFVGLTAYAIVRHELMDIRVVIQRGVIYTTLFALIIIFYLIVLSSINYVLHRSTAYGEVQMELLLAGIITTTIGIFGVPFIERLFRRLTDKIFFKERYDYSEALQDISEILNRNIHLDQMLKDLSRALKKTYKTGKVHFFLIPENIMFDETEELRTLEKFYSDTLIEQRTKHPEPIVHSMLPHILKEVRQSGMKSDLEVSTPIMLKRKIIGFMALGKKLSGDPYTPEDLILLQTCATQAAVAIEKARLYDQVKRHSRELETKVEERTSQLKKIQTSQKQMMFDISHAFKTPLALIKGEIDHLRKRDPKSDALITIEKSTDEATKLITGLLRLARLQSTRQSGAVHQGRQERHQMDEAVVPQVPRQCRSAPASCPGLQSRQLHADPGLAEGGGTLVADHATGEAGQDRGQGRPPWSLCHLPIGRGCRAEGTVPENPEPDR